jgi:FtsH-binding integral membrane protein
MDMRKLAITILVLGVVCYVLPLLGVASRFLYAFGPYTSIVWLLFSLAGALLLLIQYRERKNKESANLPQLPENVEAQKA